MIIIMNNKMCMEENEQILKFLFSLKAQQAIKKTTSVILTIREVDNDDDDGDVMKYFVTLLLVDSIMLK
jgi:hypothetical protein